MSAAFSIGEALARLNPERPRIIVDADEVLLRFVDGLDKFLRRHDLFLDLSTYRLHGNVKRLDDGTAILDVEVTALLEEFREELDWLEAVEGAQDSLAALAKRADVVVLTNITPGQATARSRNFASLGMSFPIVSNSGPKGPAVRALSAKAPTFFIDDIGQHLASSAEHAPDVIRIHLVGDDRLKSLMPKAAHANLSATDWYAARAFIDDILDRASA